MVFMSVWYHREAEKNPRVARIELCSTSALFAYGALQGLHAPSALLLACEVACACVTLATYAACFRLSAHAALYDLWHPLGLHLVPAAWALLVALFHRSLLPGAA